MNHAPTIKLHLFFATQNDRAVILRQGPSKLFRMILWHRGTDRFEDGQWLKHKIYVDRCDLSPDGKHFLFFALDGKWGSPAKGSYTAISRPPYFTAVLLHPQGDTWGGGGMFVSNTEYAIDGCRDDALVSDGTRWVRVERPGHSPQSLQQEDYNAFQRAKAQQVTDLGYRVEGHHLYRIRDGSLIRDFSDMTFEPIKAPYNGVGEQAWHPDEAGKGRKR